MLLSEKQLNKIKIISIDKILAKIIKRIHFNESISVLFKLKKSLEIL